MTSSQTRAPSNPSSPAPARSFLSRLKSPLSSKSRNYTEFYIQSDDPHRQYAPGDVISGTVIIKIVKPLRITHLVVSLHGYAQVFKNPNTPGDAYKTYSATVGSGKGKKGGNYFGNGFASLFEDEVVLCGEGRLGEGVYHFNFELEFPTKGLPSSIDFERGTISYMLTATLTRPTTMSPTTSCDTKVTLVDALDIAPVPEPKSRVISLEPISRRSRGKTARRRLETAEAEGPPRTPIKSEAPRVPLGETNGTADEAECPRSPSPSDVSYESQRSSGNSGTEYGIRSVNTITENSSSVNGSRTTMKGKTITATIDVLKGGFLRGDQVPIKVNVKHTKHVRSLKGIIVTLYRQARVDMHPALPVAPNSKGDKKKTEDYYPKSRTGLGGLSLSSAGSSHLFRKDLSQSFAPLFVDPRTLTADVKCAVRVPDEVFPTISNVPGAMISFRYYVEVIVDIQGKLTGLDRMVANAGLITVPSATSGREDTSNMFSTLGGNFVDTDQIRREKGVVSSLFEVVIGTKDSERNGKRRQVQVPEEPTNVYPTPTEANGTNPEENYDQDYYGYDENSQYYDYGYDPAYYDIPGYDQNGTQGGFGYHAPPQPPVEEPGLSEKERIRRAEATLLPSQPPGSPGAAPSSSSVSQRIPPSAPIIEEDEPNAPYFPPGPSGSTNTHSPPPPFQSTSSSLSLSRTSTAPTILRRTTASTQDDERTVETGSSTTIHATQSTRTTHTTNDTNDPNDPSKPLPPLPPQSPATAVPSSSAPAPDYFPPSSSTAQAYIPPTDDKQELQRQRLQMEQSAPPTELDDDNHPSLPPSSHGASANPNTRAFQNLNLNLAPSAPILDDEDEGLVDAMRAGRVPAQGIGRSANAEDTSSRRVSEALPEYRR